jgi:hypothetical protein
MDPFLAFEIPVILGVFALGWLLIVRPLQKERAQRKLPFTRDLLRGPGEACLEKIEELSDKLETQLLAMFIAPAAIVAYAFGIWHGTHVPQRLHPLYLTVFLIIALLASAWSMMRTRALIRERRQYRLGFLGERYTAQALDRLAGEGYAIFHDLQCRKPGTDDAFNIDHALVGPAGIFVVETKTRSKRANQAGRAEVVFDGHALHFGTHRETAPIDQALASASLFAKLVKGRTGLDLPVTPILSIPGWWVVARTHQPLFVGNPDQIPAHIRSRAAAATLDKRAFEQARTLCEELARSKVE